MPSNDIYNNREKYNYIMSNYKQWGVTSNNKHSFLNEENLDLIPLLANHCDCEDTSYIRRIRLLYSLKVVCAGTSKTLRDISENDDRDEINKIVVYARKFYSLSTMSCFLTDLKIIFKILFPERDSKGRVDETIVPYVVRHLKIAHDKSREKARKDIISYADYMKLIDSFSSDPRMQAFISLIYESLGRPQEVLYLKLKDVQLFDNYGKATISEHGKEGIGILRIIESYPYMLKWLNQHPLKDNPDAYLFVNLSGNTAFKQLKSATINKALKNKCELLGINKVTCYSFKRNGVTHKRLRGDDDKQIQETARWNSTRQLKTYDLAGQDEAYKVDLMKRGLIPVDEKHAYLEKEKILQECYFCGTSNELHAKTCIKCDRLIDRKAIEEQEQKTSNELSSMKEMLKSMLLSEDDVNIDKMRKFKEVLSKI